MVAESTACFKFENNLAAALLAITQRSFFYNSPYNFVATQVAGKIGLFPRVFCWQQVLASILIGLFCLVPMSFPAFFAGTKYLPRVLIGLF